jgi:hypothetical protein
VKNGFWEVKYITKEVNYRTMNRLIIIIFFLVGCTKEAEDLILSKKTFSLKIDSVLNPTGTRSVLFDNNGYYHLKLDPTKNQTLSRVTGKILADGKEPYPPEKVDWESNLYWSIKRGDTVAIITKSYINYFTGQFTIVSLPPLIASKDELVPTSNFASYSGKGGEINNMIAPIYKMRGDTLILKTTHSTSKQIVFTKIVLD